MFDVPVTEKLRKEWDVNIPIEEKPWQIGLIIGASGSGKTTLAGQLAPGKIHQGFEWKADCLLDDFPAECSVTDITTVLSQVGFSSPPSWMLPYRSLSNGQKFRVELARCLFEYPDLFLFDEFTSVVDRQVAQIGAWAFQKAIRKTKKQFIAVTCHYDVEAWLQPDWVYDVSTNEFKWGSVRRPEIKLEIFRVHYKAWHLFKDHHYLSSSISQNAICYVGCINGVPVVFNSWKSFFGSKDKKTQRNAKFAHRMVVLPDYQGLGLSNILTEQIAAMWDALNYRVLFRTSHPAEIAKKNKSLKWGLISQGRSKADNSKTYRRATDRAAVGFRWRGGALLFEEVIALLSR